MAALDADRLLSRLVLIAQQLSAIEGQLAELLDREPRKTLGPEITQLCNTIAGAHGQVIPGQMQLSGQPAREYFQALGESTMLPLNELPPWTHLALAGGSWWLLVVA